MSRYTITLAGRTYQVELQQRRGTNLSFLIDGTPYSVDIAAEQVTGVESKAKPTTSAPKPADTDLRAPMPGIISEVRVAVGAQVAIGDVLVVIEAMKMENPIKAKRAGKVTEVRASKGQEVAAGAVLMLID